MILLTWGCMVDKELEQNKSVIKDMLGNKITRSETIDLYRSIHECEVSKDVFINYLMGIIGGCYGNKMC